VSIFLRSDCQTWGHAGIAKGLRVGEMPFAIFVNEVSFSAERRDAFRTGFHVRTAGPKLLKVVGKFVILEHMLTVFAYLVIGVKTGLCIGLELRSLLSEGRHLRHFMWDGCLHFGFISVVGIISFLSCFCLLTIQLMHMPFSPWLHFAVLKLINNNIRF
jgi:hypothetical protein